MSIPTLRTFNDEAECKNYYVDNYCNKEIKTHDGIVVKFHEDTFEHAFYLRSKKTWKAKKDFYSQDRGERIDWIKYVLQDASIISRQGYDKAKKKHDNSRRVTFLGPNNYLVVIQITGEFKARFITAYIVDSSDVAKKINAGPEWIKPW